MTVPTAVMEETERLLGGRTRDIHLDGDMLRLYRERTWPQRAKIVRAWMVWVGGLNLFMVGISAVLTPHLIGWSLVLSGALMPLLHAAGWLMWQKPRDHRLQAASLIAVVLGTMLTYGCFGELAGGADSERYLTSAMFLVAVAVVVFDIGLGWTLAMGLGGLSLFLIFLIFNPALDLLTALAVTLFFGMGLAGTLMARRTATILAQKSFLISLRDRQRSEALAEANAKLQQLATTDTLTGVANRRSVNAHIARLWADPAVPQAGIAFIMADIDHFKQLNDIRGHAAGDDCIRRVAKVLKDSVRAGSDIASRYGGEEFLVVLKDTTPALASAVAERMRGEVEKLSIPSGVPDIPVTISVGIACGRDGVGIERVAKWADDALYQAKRRGRNRVFFSEA